ncbi:unnamed protein product [Callosobruchus maculatus]|uniref:Uncharacterized protein n=1 Tax=Callosobruchus maculatus TaxID=64391 RepID=A0A653BIJ8_CALMS|nr:unnamed protein product [Callosobruchus maculatus]
MLIVSVCSTFVFFTSEDSPDSFCFLSSSLSHFSGIDLMLILSLCSTFIFFTSEDSPDSFCSCLDLTFDCS